MYPLDLHFIRSLQAGPAISRTQFLKQCAIALLAVFVDPGTALLRKPRQRFPSADSFSAHVNETFVVETASARERVILKNVARRPRSRHVEQFSLVFHGAHDLRIGDGMYRLHHPSLGTLELFIAAIGMPNNRRSAYEACFSRQL